MLRLIIIFALCISCTLAMAEGDRAHESENGRFWVHGRLSAWNGTSTFRIWVIGTKRILGVNQAKAPNSDYPEMPQDLTDIFSAQIAIFGTDIYGDFLVEPLAPDEKGVMRPVRIIAFKKSVVTYVGKIVPVQKLIKTDPSQLPGISQAWPIFNIRQEKYENKPQIRTLS